MNYIKVVLSKDGSYICEFRCDIGSGHSIVIGDVGFVISACLTLAKDEKYIVGIGCTPLGKGIGKLFILEMFDYFKVNKFYLSSSDNHPVWSKIATKVYIIKDKDTTIFSLTREQLM